MYIENLIEDLRSLASREFQEVAWYENDLGAMTSFRDDVSDIFDDHNFKELLYKKGDVVISKEVHQALRDLDNVVDHVGYERSEDEIINSPEMEIVRQKAAKTLELIKASDGSESTVDFIKVGTSDVPITIEEALKEESYIHNIISAAKKSR
jgi:hypothetical protein